MATEAQINANRANAKASTGPKSPEGKEKSSANSTKFGLFATDSCIQPHEQEAYDHFCDALWQDLAPSGPVQEVTAAEFIRNAWRLRRCATTEARLGFWANIIQTSNNKKSGNDRPMGDPVIYADCLPAQNSVDRARVQAQGCMHRAKTYLDKLQVIAPKSEPVAEAPSQAAAVPDTAPQQNAAPKEDTVPQDAPAQNEPNFATPPETKRTQSAPLIIPRNPRNQPCPCGSGVKFKRCCSSTAPPLLQKAA
jgi:hypothetical protein